MTKDRTERRTYRKSPGRQYGYEYDPLRSQQGRNGRADASGPGERWTEESVGRSLSRSAESSGVLSQRPDLRRTRQLLRQNILASKSRAAVYDEEDAGLQEFEGRVPSRSREQEERDRTLYGNRYLARGNRPSQALQQHYPETDADEGLTTGEVWHDEEVDYMDPDLGYEDGQEMGLGYEDDLDQQVDFPEVPERVPTRRPVARRTPPGGYLPLMAVEHNAGRSGSLEYEDEEAYPYEDEPSRPRRRKKRLTRRGLLLGLGAAAVGGGAIAAYEYGPKLPQMLGDAGTNIERQLADAFKRGFDSGAEAVRKDFITALEDMEGVSLNAAMGAAALLRHAYDAFVNPLVTLAANVTGDFLNVTLRAFMQARHWLANIGQDNSTLASLQAVLETWTKQVTQMPKQLQAITDADLDGAQAYLRGVQRKIDAEKAKLNGQSPTPTPKPPANAPSKK